MRRTRAFSLLECVFAAFLFSTVMVLSFAVWPTYARAADQNRGRIGATFIARQELESALSQGFAAATGRISTVNLTATVDGHVIVTPYNVQLQVANVDPNLKALHVRVTWTEYTRTSEVTCDCYLSR